MSLRLSFLLHLLLIFAVGYLYYSQYDSTGENATQTAAGEMEETDTLHASAAVLPMRIAYVNTDSIDQNYLLVKDMYEQLSVEKLNVERRIQSKIKAFETKYAEMQKKAPYMTQEEGRAAQSELQAMEFEIQELQSKLTTQFNEKELAMQRDFFEKVRAYLTELNEEKGFDYILGFQEGGQVLLAKDSLDITSAVLEGLNRTYKAEKEKAK